MTGRAGGDYTAAYWLAVALLVVLAAALCCGVLT